MAGGDVGLLGMRDWPIAREPLRTVDTCRTQNARGRC